MVQEGKTFEESVTTSNCDATRHNGNWYKLSFEELQTGQWLVHVRIVCVSLHQLILGSMNKQSCNSISLVISQLKNFDIFVNKFFVLPTSASKYGNRVSGVRIFLAARQTIRNGDILLNNIEKKQDFKLVVPFTLTPLLLFKPFWWEGSKDKVISAS